MTAISFIPAPRRGTTNGSISSNQRVDEPRGADVPSNQDDRAAGACGGTPCGRRPIVLGSCCVVLSRGDRLRFPFRGGGAVAGGRDVTGGLRVVQRLEHPGR